jgi:hypothetical protein
MLLRKLENVKKLDYIEHANKKYSTFTYVGKETRYITRLFNNTNLKISFMTTNTLKHLLPPKFNVDKYKQNGVCRLDCQTCPLNYVGQSGRQFKARFKEHIHALKENKDTSMFAQHILSTGHAYSGREDTVKIFIKSKNELIRTLMKSFIFMKFPNKGCRYNQSYI